MALSFFSLSGLDLSSSGMGLEVQQWGEQLAYNLHGMAWLWAGGV